MRIYRLFVLIRLYFTVLFESILPVFRDFKRKLNSAQRMLDYERYIQRYGHVLKVGDPTPAVQRIRKLAQENYKGPIVFTEEELEELKKSNE